MSDGKELDTASPSRQPFGLHIDGDMGLLRELIVDTRLLYEHARKAGKPIPGKLLKDVSILLSLRVGDGDKSSAGGDGSPLLEQAMRAHDDLQQVVDPVTASTIRSSSLKHNHLLQMVAAFGIVAFSALVYVSFKPPEQDVIVRMCGAILGSALYVFWTARNFLRDETFSDRYSQSYVVRFGIGVIAGFILGTIAQGKGGGADDGEVASALQSFGPFTLSVVGGFSAEAVVQILQRIAEVLVTAVKGGDREVAKAEAEKNTTKALSKASTDLTKALAGDREDLEVRIQEISEELLKR